MYTALLPSIRFLLVLSTWISYTACLFFTNITIPATSRFQHTAASGSIVQIASQPNDTPSSSSPRGLTSSVVLPGNDIADECWAQWEHYSTSSQTCAKTTTSGPGRTYPWTLTSTIYKTYKLCDGHPRALASGGYQRSTFIGEGDNGTTVTSLVTVPPNGTPLSTAINAITTVWTNTRIVCAVSVTTPSCSIGNDECISMFSAWTAGGFSRIKPPCYYTTTGGACDRCWLYIPSVKLIYFPVTMTGNFCGNYRTVNPTLNGNVSTPTAVEVSGTTFTSGFAYLSYAGITASAGVAGTCGTPKPGGILPMISSDVSSYRGHAAAMEIAGDIQWPFNFADLAPNPVPWDAWINQELCVGHEDYPNCKTITDAAYRPWLVYPSAFWSMEPQWSKCTSAMFGIMDPPSALPLAPAMAMPTSTSPVLSPTVAASPKQDPSKSVATPTNRPWRNGVTDDRRASSAMPGDPGVQRSTTSNFRSETRVVKTVLVPTSALLDTPVSVGTMRILPASQVGAISIGANVLPGGRITTIGNDVVSLRSKSVFVAVEPEATGEGSDPQNALSILASVHTIQDPRVTFTLDGLTHAAYSGGIVAAAATTMVLPPDATTIMGKHTMSLGTGGILIDSTTFNFKWPKPTTASEHYSITQVAGELVAAVYTHAASRITLFGNVDPNGSTVLTHGSSTFTYAGHDLIENGVTFDPIVTTRPDLKPHNTSMTVENPLSQNVLPSVVSANDTIEATTDHLITASSPYRRPELGTSTSSSTSSSGSTEPTISAVAFLAYILFLVLTRT